MKNGNLLNNEKAPAYYSPGLFYYMTFCMEITFYGLALGGKPFSSS
jgi:hypothetical protein